MRLRRSLARRALTGTKVPLWTPPTDGMDMTRSPGMLRPGRRIYAIGDIHGCLDHLRALHARIVDDLARRPVGGAKLIHLGNYIDIGPEPVGVIALLAAGRPIAGLPTINLMGDHERTALDALDGDAPSATDWLLSGGDVTLRGWGIAPRSLRTTWRDCIPAEHLAFLRGLTLFHQEGDYLFVHAGLRPGVALQRQDPDDLLRIRQPFLYSEQAFPAVVVHGHSAAPSPVLRKNRIGIDTGAATGGSLTCAVLEEDRVAFLQVS